MKKRYAVVGFFFTLFLVQIAFGQAKDARLKTKGYVNPQEIVSLDSTMRMDQALLVIGELSKQFAGKIIVDLEKRRNPIGVYVVNQHWRDALEMILNANNLWYQEEADYIQITATGTISEGPTAPGEKAGEPKPTLESRDVKISAVFFTANVSKLQEYGISWNFFRSKDKEPTINIWNSAGLGRGDTVGRFNPLAPTGGMGINPSLSKATAFISSPPEFKFANIDALVKFFGSNDLGEVITSPEVVVRNGKQGKIQVGKDIYVTQRDIAGNTVNQLVQTGTIIDVTPIVYTQADTDFVYLNLTIEQSSVSPGPEINRTQVKTHALLFDGEETVIGGLYTTLETESREGIPFLKDLPPWFFGLRYLFGSESKLKTKQELIVLIKVELLSPIRNRIETKDSQQDVLKMKRMEYQKDFEKK